MASDKDLFLDRFQQQIGLLKDLRKAIDEAIGRAEGKLKDMDEGGKSMEQVFGPVPPKNQ